MNAKRIKSIALIFSIMLMMNLVLLPTGAANNVPKTKIFSSSQNIGQYNIKSDVGKVIINSNVTLTGNFYIEDRTTPLTIEGKGVTSILKGKEGTRKHGIEADSSFTLNLKNFKSLNPTYYHTRLIKTKINAYKVHLVDDRRKTQENSDGFSGAGGSVYDGCYINTWDDSFKIYYGTYTVKNTTIIHNQNGAPFQMGWGDAINDNCKLILDNVTVKSNSDTYNMGVFTWAGGKDIEERTIDIVGQGLKRVVNKHKNSNNKLVNYSVAKLYQFGSSKSNTANNKTINVKCIEQDKSKYKSTVNNTYYKNGSKNSKVKITIKK